MTDPVTNAADLMFNYTDDEMKAAVWEEVGKVVREIVREEILTKMADPSTAERFIVNNAFMFNKQVMRAVRDHFASDSRIY
jgi:hypothetical protein